MPYVDYAYYTDTYNGELVEETDFPILEQRASEIIDELTMYQVAQKGLEAYDTFVQERFKKAICAQIDAIENKGGVDAIDEEDYQSVALGKFNYSKAQTNSSSSKISPRARSLLAPTGLLYRGI